MSKLNSDSSSLCHTINLDCKSEYIKTLLKCLVSRKARNKIKENRRAKKDNFRLFMTYLVKDEEEIIEKNILFHKEMGVDGFIVTSHNSTDRTNEILERLKKKGIVLEIFYKDSPYYEQSRWVGDMIHSAAKYGADWVINADADEFYYSKSLNLKKSICEANNNNVNVLWVDSIFLFPDDRKSFLECPYFVKRPFQKFEAEMLNIDNHNIYKNFIGSQNCFKVIHKTKGFREIAMGNHNISMRNSIKVQSADINLYHYHIKGYEGYKAKVLNWINTGKNMPEGMGTHIKALIKLYENGKLRENYVSIYNKEVRNFLIEQGVVVIDPSVSNFLKYKKII